MLLRSPIETEKLIFSRGVDTRRGLGYSKPAMRDQPKAYAFALLAVLAWSTVATAFKIALRYLSFIELLFYAALVSALALAAVVAATGRGPELRRCSLRDIRSSALLGFLNPFAYYLILFQAYARLPAQIAQPLNYTWAVVIVILSAAFMKQRIAAIRWAGIATSYAGVWVIATGGRMGRFGPVDGLGIALALASSLVWASYWLMNTRDRRDPLVKMLLGNVFGLLYVALAALLFLKPGPGPALTGLAAAAYVGLFEMGVTFVLWLRALRLSRTTAEVSNLIFLTPFVSLLLINYVLGERVQASSVLGLGLIVAGILLPQLKKSRP